MLSWLALFNSCLVLLGLYSVINLNWFGLCLSFLLGSLSIWATLKEVVSPEQNKRYATAFSLFIVSEAIVFGTLFWSLLWCHEGMEAPISAPLELPFMGCAFLLTSSVSASAYHTRYGFVGSYIFLAITIILGLLFIRLQVKELHHAESDFTFSVFAAASYATVGLHFVHVVVGVLAMTVLLFRENDNSNRFYASVVIWYWHFVDYVWLWVYLLVYYAS